MEKIYTYKEKSWEWIENREGRDVSFNGKYLFFSSERRLLKGIARQEISKHGFTCAKVLINHEKIKNEYALHIYHSDRNREAELKVRYAKKKDVRYIGWVGDTLEIKELFDKMCVYKKEGLPIR